MYEPPARRGSDRTSGPPPDQAHSTRRGRILFIETEKSTSLARPQTGHAFVRTKLRAAATTCREIAFRTNKPPVIPARPSRRKVISPSYRLLRVRSGRSRANREIRVQKSRPCGKRGKKGAIPRAGWKLHLGVTFRLDLFFFLKDKEEIRLRPPLLIGEINKRYNSRTKLLVY